MVIVGCGYVGRLIARRLIERGRTVTGVVRSAETAQAASAIGANALQLDLEHDDLAAIEWTGASVFHLAPPPGHGTEDPATARLLSWFAQRGHPRRLVYISTSGVYGDCGGAWVDEARPVYPATERAMRRWDAEQRLRVWRNDSGSELVILRVAGIYACDRLPLDRIRARHPIVNEDEAPWSNRVHAADLTEVCLAAMQRAPNGAIYNVCDDAPSTMTDYFCRIADAAGLPRPPQIRLADAQHQLSAGMLSYLGESRRLSNRLMHDELRIRLRFPTLADGLAACFPIP